MTHSKAILVTKQKLIKQQTLSLKKKFVKVSKNLIKLKREE